MWWIIGAAVWLIGVAYALALATVGKWSDEAMRKAFAAEFGEGQGD